jgi:GT2 family glycosyltransferase
MKSFYECEFFTSEKIKNNKFIVSQKELLLKQRLTNDKGSFKIIDVEYHCLWERQKDWSNDRPTIIIPIKDNVELMSVTISNLVQHNLNKHCNIIIVDDRSEEDIKSLTNKSELSYLRVDNDKGFNFSMLNNIAAKICYDLGIKTIILWNSDLWCVKEEWFLELLDRHYKEDSVISGTRLVYPPIDLSLNKEEDNENIKNNFPHMLNGKWRNTIQFGGDAWLQIPGDLLSISPLHNGRFFNIEDPRVNCDRGSAFITGALQVLNLRYFIESGGLNPSLSKNYQDTDYCLRSISDKKIPRYFGKDIFFYHDESFNFENNKNEKKQDKQLTSDYILFSKIWNNKIIDLLY